MARHPHTLDRANASTNGQPMRDSRNNGIPIHTTSNNNEAPPPSTLAAQIVQNQTVARASQQQQQHQQGGEKATFSGLLHEILHNPAATPETDLSVNVQLISVVVEAGLSVLARDDPFAQFDVLVPQAEDSLSVVQATIVRQPEVLLAPISADGPPLLLWLVARLVALCGRPRCEGLKIAGMVDAAIRALEKSGKLWRSAEDVKALVRDCVNGTLCFHFSTASIPSQVQ